MKNIGNRSFNRDGDWYYSFFLRSEPKTYIETQGTTMVLYAWNFITNRFLDTCIEPTTSHNRILITFEV